jgi:hypothetical protein
MNFKTVSLDGTASSYYSNDRQMNIYICIDTNTFYSLNFWWEFLSALLIKRISCGDQDNG